MNIQLKLKRPRARDDFTTPSKKISRQIDDDDDSADESPASIRLPGGELLLDQTEKTPESLEKIKCREAIKGRFYLRQYLDTLFGAIAECVERKNLSDRSAIEFIPDVVNTILLYNNLQFAKIDLFLTDKYLYEPIMFILDTTYAESPTERASDSEYLDDYALRGVFCDVPERHNMSRIPNARNRVMLFVNKSQYEDYCAKSSANEVFCINGQINIEKYNPTMDLPEQRIKHVSIAMQKLVIACDLVCTRIINEIYGQFDEDKPRVCGEERDEPINHPGWNTHGTTLHSMLEVSVVPQYDSTEQAHYSQLYALARGLDGSLVNNIEDAVDSLARYRVPRVERTSISSIYSDPPLPPKSIATQIQIATPQQQPQTQQYYQLPELPIIDPITTTAVNSNISNDMFFS